MRDNGCVSEATPEPDPALRTEVTADEVVVRRTPKYGTFIALGAIVGVIAALVLTFALPENDTYDQGQVFGFLLLFLGTVGVALGSLIALVLDRVFARRASTVAAEHETAHRADAAE